MSATTAKAVRQALAAAGFGRNDVSVRNDSYSMGSTVYVRIRRADIALDVIEQIASAHESVRRDTEGDILSGGNTFVTVEYGHGALDAATVAIRAMLDANVRTFGALELTVDEHDPDRIDAWAAAPDGTGVHVVRLSLEYGAERLTRALAARGELTAVLAAPAAPAEVAAAPAELAPAAALELACAAAAPLAGANDVAPELAPAAAPELASPAALIIARKLLIAAQLQDIAAQLSSVTGSGWDLAGDLARVIRTLDGLPVFGRFG